MWDAYCRARLALAGVVLLLAACGGGGGGGGGTADLSTAPGITVSPTSLSFAATRNGALPPTQAVQITISALNAAFVGLAVPAGNSPTWLDLSQARLTRTSWTAAIVSTNLAPGTYTTTVQIGIGDINGNVLAYRNVQVSYTVQPLVGLGANPQSLGFSQLQGAAAPSSQTLGITELGGASYAWNASVIYQSGSGWLNVNGAGSASGATLPTSLTVSINATVALGTLNAVIRLTGNGHTLDVPVSYTLAEPTLTRSPASLTFNALRLGSAPATQDVTLTTQGSLPLNYTTSVTYGAGASGWLSVPASGTAPGAVTAGVNTTTLPPGSYTATLGINTAAQSLSVSVTYVVSEPTLTRSPATLTFNAVSSGVLPASQDVTLSTQQNLGLGFSASVNYGSATTGWLNAPTSGTAPTTISIGVNTTNLVPGTYTATVVLTTAAQTVQIGITYVVATSSLTFSPTSPSFVIDTTSLASALSQNVGVGSTGVTLSWTAASSQPWLTVSPPSGSSGTQVTLSLVPSQLDTLDAGTRSATITFSYAPPNQGPASAPLSVSLNLQIPKVTSVNPYVAISSTSLEVILRGTGFSNPGGTAVSFDGTPGTSPTLVSDTELRVTHPSLPAASYRVSVPNQLGNANIVRSTANLVVVDAPVYAAATIAYPAIPSGFQRVPRKIIYDAERKALVIHLAYANTSGIPTSSEIQRYAFNGSTWSTTPTQVPLSAPFNGAAATLDGKRLLVTSGNAIQEYDMATLAAGASTSVALGSVLSPFLDKLAVANDGNALVTSGIFGSGFTPTFKFSVADRTFTQGTSLFIPDAGGSADGSLLVLTENGLSPPPAVYVYNASTGTLSPTSLFENLSFPILDRTGNRIMLSGFTIYNRSLQKLGDLAIGGSFTESHTLSPNGLRAYAADTLFVPKLLRTFDLAATPVAGQFLEIGSGTPLPSDPGRGVMTVSPDGGTVFIAGSDAIIVVPTP